MTDSEKARAVLDVMRDAPLHVEAEGYNSQWLRSLFCYGEFVSVEDAIVSIHKKGELRQRYRIVGQSGWTSAPFYPERE